MKVTIKSRKLAKTITFTRPGREYIFADLNGRPGTLGVQICKGGWTSGSTMFYLGDDQAIFNRLCRYWYRAYIRNATDVRQGIANR